MEISSSRFGKISFLSKEFYSFSKGIYGFPAEKKFLFLKLREYVPLIWLQSTEKPDLTIPLFDPALFFPDYKADLLENELKGLKVTDLKRLEIYIIVNLSSSLEKAQVNLIAPTITNPVRKIGKQIVLNKE